MARSLPSWLIRLWLQAAESREENPLLLPLKTAGSIAARLPQEFSRSDFVTNAATVSN
jgi:hypothetical protein